MILFLRDILASALGFMLVIVVFALITADHDTRTSCDATTSGPVDQTACIMQDTLK